MTQINRLAVGGRIDRSKPIEFIWDGKKFEGYAGDTLASALLANGIDVIARSFKYSRPRGIVAAGAEEPNAIVQLGATEASQVPNVRATQQPLYAALVAAPTSSTPSRSNDLMSLVGKVGGSAMPPGFYYKTFMFPKSMWMTYEKYIRRAAGMGRSPQMRDPDIYEKVNQHCDVLIVGAGPAGLLAALGAVHSGARVIIADEQEELGGSLLASKELINGKAPADWVVQVTTELAASENALLLPRSTVNGYHDHNFVTIAERCSDHLGDVAPVGMPRQKLHRVRAKWVVLATGCHERPLVYGNNDVPGCMLCSAVSSYICRYGVVPGRRLVVSTANDAGYQAALDWYDAGRDVAAIVDARSQVTGDMLEAARARGIDIILGSAVINVTGKCRVKSAEVALINSEQHCATGTVQSINCDTVATSGGFSPAVHLSCHTGVRPRWRDDIIGFVPGEQRERCISVGALAGHYSTAAIFKNTLSTLQPVFTDLNLTCQLPEPPVVTDPIITKPMALFHVPHTKPTARAPKQFVDYQNDVTAAGIELACREGFESIEHVKRYTALGFGTDQGKLSNINGMAIAARAQSKPIAEVGTTVFRPNYTPVSFGAIVGRDCGNLFDPQRYTAMHEWHLERGAIFEDVGQWKRPWYFPEVGESMFEAVNRECLATRSSVGILDASTLGKIDIQGKDAREFLGRIYTNAWAKLAPGRCRYGLMCGEDGMVFDDGVTACLGENHFLMTTTTGGAARVLEWLEFYHQTEWPELEIYMTSVTDHWATLTLSGPNSRALLAQLTDCDLAANQFKYMDWRHAAVAGVPARIFRISFTGELSFEINVQANYGLAVWEALFESGQAFNLTPYGTEAMHVLRSEKGFIIAGQDTDGSVHPYDLGMGWAVNNNKSFSFIGKRGMARADCRREDRKQWVGLKTRDPSVVLPEGAQGVFDLNAPIPMPMVGHVTSSYWSANLGHSIAQGFVKGGHDRMGQSVFYPLADGRVVEAEICSPVFYDPTGARQDV